MLAFIAFEEDISNAQAPLEPDERNEWKNNDAQAKAVIGFGLEMSILIMFGKLKVCSSCGRSHKFVSTRNFVEPLNCSAQILQCKDVRWGRFLPFLTRIRQLSADQKAMGVTNIDQELCMILLPRLLHRFEHPTVAVDTIAEGDRQTVEFFKSWLLQEEQKMNSRTTEST